MDESLVLTDKMVGRSGKQFYIIMEFYSEMGPVRFKVSSRIKFIQ